jgi:hypothetical protein
MRFLIPIAFLIAAALPSAAFAQQTQPVPGSTGVCGTPAVPMMTEGELAVPQPDTLGRHDVGVLDFSAVRGSIVHMEGNMMLLKLDQAGQGNAAPNHALAGDTWAVVQLPDGCPMSNFSMGTPILAVGTPNGHGVLEAVEVSPAG